PNIQSVSYASTGKNAIKLVFDQDVKWDKEILGRFYLDDLSADLISVSGTGRILTLQLAESSTAKTLSYVRGGKWRQADAIIRGANDIAALTFCELPIQPARSLNDQ
ncbi:MAG: hypothetical protein L7W43_09910, partial [Rubripirellula sp.]|nr:hypothetical protein [Rubripirellula sp.]